MSDYKVKIALQIKSKQITVAFGSGHLAWHIVRRPLAPMGQDRAAIPMGHPHADTHSAAATNHQLIRLVPTTSCWGRALHIGRLLGYSRCPGRRQFRVYSSPSFPHTGVTFIHMFFTLPKHSMAPCNGKIGDGEPCCETTFHRTNIFRNGHYRNKEEFETAQALWKSTGKGPRRK